ncbi:hypothetical protein BKA70DRAFT_1233763 [Coprinopsis sp. MPI-PUGE-AT-0042]|nr:hypothetical protein BKA70DRAFT_1233763 [Coprinopsis sp. MPI-PUGE-AT-0042]
MESLRAETCNAMLIGAAASMHCKAVIQPHPFLKSLHNLFLNDTPPAREDLTMSLFNLDCDYFPFDWFPTGWWSAPDKRCTVTADDLVLEWRRCMCAKVSVSILRSLRGLKSGLWGRESIWQDEEPEIGEAEAEGYNHSSVL